MFYHFKNEEAIRQIEISLDGVFLTSTEKPFNGESFLTDQGFDCVDWEEEEIISKEEFEQAWIKYTNLD